MSCGNTYNQTSLEIAEAQYKQRLRSPSTALRAKWHKEFLESGAQYKMSFYTFQKHKTTLWHREKNWKLNPNKYFNTGKHKGKRIKDIIMADIDWITFILEKHPKGRVAKQIITFIENNPEVLK